MGFSFDTLINTIKNPFHPPDPTDPFGKNLGMAKTPGQGGGGDPAATPAGRDLSTELQAILGQVNGFAGANYAAQQQYNPLLTLLNQTNFGTALRGTPTFDAQSYLAAHPDLANNYNSDPNYATTYGSLENYAQADYKANGNSDPQYMKADPNSAIALTRDAYNQANPGLVAYTSGLQSVMDKLNAAAPPGVKASIYDAATAAPAMSAAASAGPASLAAYSRARATTANGGPLLNPLQGDAMANLGQVSPIQAQLNQQASSLLATNGGLTQGELQSAQDSARSAYTDRGLLRSNTGIGAEILSTDAARRSRLLENANFAAGVDASGQQQLAQNRGYALNVQGQGQNLSTTNAGLLTGASTFNAGQLNAINQYNAGQTNQMGQFNAGLLNNSNQFNASLLNNANQFNASAQNAAGQFNAAANNNMGQFNATLTQQNLNDAWNRATEYGGMQLAQAQNPLQLASGLSGQVPDYTTSLLGYGSDLYNTNYNAASAAKISAGNNSAANNSAMIGGGASLAAAAIIAF